MNIVDALHRSKETGYAYSREGSGYNGWIRWNEHWTYRLTAEDLVADDWVIIGLDNSDGFLDKRQKL